MGGRSRQLKRAFLFKLNQTAVTSRYISHGRLAFNLVKQLLTDDIEFLLKLLILLIFMFY